MAYSFKQLDPRDISSEHNAKIFGLGKVYGIEVTVPELAEKCVVNLDHHGPGSTSDVPSAVEQAMTCPLPEDGSILATIRPDADSVGAMAVLNARLAGEAINATLVMALGLINRKRPKEVKGYEAYKPECVAIGRMSANFKLELEARVQWVQGVLTGHFNKKEVEALMAARNAEYAAAWAASQVRLTPDGKVAVVISSHRFAIAIGYEAADIVIALNERMPVNPRDATQGTYIKYTVARCDSRVPFAIQAAMAELNEREASRRRDGLRWGGQENIIGSPQGASSTLTLDEVIAIVEAKVS
ncbi:hypothetical protein IJI99_02395 [bacterium]|nr:hypothetical protein [bacterium]